MLRKLLFCGTSAVAIMCASSAYAATFSFGFTGEVESGTIETSGTYELRLRGADGGAATGGFSFDGARGGFGALLIGEVDLFAGDLFSVLVGGAGVSGYDAGGGGGLSYFSSGTNLAIAGGGGGASGSRYLYLSDQGGNARGAQEYLGRGGNSTYVGVQYESYYYYGFYTSETGGGGAGWTGSGDGPSGGQSGPGWSGGQSFEGDGGFGGGGGVGIGYGFYLGGGGAGAYGGYAGQTDSFLVVTPDTSYVTGSYTVGGRGGSSYFSSSFFNTASVAGQARAGGAYLTLELLTDPAPVPLPASAALLGSTILGMGFAARRRRKKS